MLTAQNKEALSQGLVRYRLYAVTRGIRHGIGSDRGYHSKAALIEAMRVKYQVSTDDKLRILEEVIDVEGVEVVVITKEVVVDIHSL